MTVTVKLDTDDHRIHDEATDAEITDEGELVVGTRHDGGIAYKNIERRYNWDNVLWYEVDE